MAHAHFLHGLYGQLLTLRDHPHVDAASLDWVNARLAAVAADLEFATPAIEPAPLTIDQARIELADLEDLADVDEIDWSGA